MKIFSIFILVLSALNSPLSFFTGTKPQYFTPEASLPIIEKVYLHIDRESYYPGDDIWFKAYLIDASDQLLTANSTNLHVELISPGLTIIDSRIVKLNNGLGNGDFKLSEKLQSGRYRLRAYTNYMRNFGDQLFFNKDITIINSVDAAEAFSDSINYKINKPEIAFFPEGGSLVEEVSSTVAFKAVDDNGFGQKVAGEIYSSTGEKITEFRSTHNGMGSFSLYPAPGLKYFALIRNRNSDSIKYDLPKSIPKGIVLNISNNQAGQLSIVFKTNSETFPLATANDLSVTVSVRNVAFKTYSFRMKSLNSFLNIPTQDLPDGIIMLTLSGSDNKPLCERLVFIQNEDEVKVKIETEKTEYNRRDSVSVKISLLVNSTIPQDAFLSLSATDDIFKDNSSRFPSNISSWFLLESDVRGPVEEPSYYFDTSNPNRLKDLDLLLLSQGWRDFEWKYKNLKYPPETGFTISGRVRKKFAAVPLKNVKVNISIFKIGNPLTTIVLTDDSGRFKLNEVDLTGKAKLVASVTGEKDNLKGWLLIDSARYISALINDSIAQKYFIQKHDQYEGDEKLKGENKIIGQNLHTFIQHAEFKNSTEKQYKLSDTITPGEVNIVAKRDDAPESSLKRSIRYLMGTPDKEIIVTPESKIYNDVYKLLVSKMILSPRDGKMPVANQGGHLMQNPLYLINGQVASKDEVKSLTVDVVERIDILDNMASYAVWGAGTGDSPIDGVISIILKNDFAASRTSLYHSANANFSGYNEPRIFYSPKHHKTLESNYKPDLRTTLFWEPNIKVENNKEVLLNYYNSDNPSKVRVIVEGITTTGIPVTGKTEYEVK